MRTSSEPGLYQDLPKERDWLAYTDPLKMIYSIPSRSVRYVPTERKFRLIGCASYRIIWDLLDEDSRNSVETAERFADSMPSIEEFKSAWHTAWRVDTPDQLAFERAAREGLGAADLVHRDARIGADGAARCPLIDPKKACAVIADVFGPLPFGKVVFDESWREEGLLRLAQEMYDEREFGRMAQLGAKLKNLGCRSRKILRHCLQAEPHFRGCWVVDFMLGKN